MIWAFFTCCDHIKDYIINDDVIDTEQIPYEYINENDCLKICRDISVGTKHLKIDNPKVPGGRFKVNLVAKKDKETGELSFDVNKSKEYFANIFLLTDDETEFSIITSSGRN